MKLQRRKQKTIGNSRYVNRGQLFMYEPSNGKSFEFMLNVELDDDIEESVILAFLYTPTKASSCSLFGTLYVPDEHGNVTYDVREDNEIVERHNVGNVFLYENEGDGDHVFYGNLNFLKDGDDAETQYRVMVYEGDDDEDYVYCGYVQEDTQPAEIIDEDDEEPEEEPVKTSRSSRTSGNGKSDKKEPTPKQTPTRVASTRKQAPKANTVNALTSKGRAKLKSYDY